MMWICFVENWRWYPPTFKGAVLIEFRPGHLVFATREAAALALDGGVARAASADEISAERAKRRG